MENIVKFFQTIKSEFNPYQTDVDRGIYFGVGMDATNVNLTTVLVHLSTTPNLTGYYDYLLFPLIIVIMNGPGRVMNYAHRLDLTRALKFYNFGFKNPIYVLCEDSYSLAKNEFLKKH